MTCGDGQISRSKDCVINEESDIELCNTDTEDFQVKSCFRDACLTGKVMVSNETEKAVTAGVEDYLFLRRYAQAVTNNGENVNTEDVENVGYGAWRLTSNDFDEILRSESRDLRANTISLSLVFNFNVSINFNSVSKFLARLRWKLNLNRPERRPTACYSSTLLFYGSTDYLPKN